MLMFLVMRVNVIVVMVLLVQAMDTPIKNNVMMVTQALEMAVVQRVSMKHQVVRSLSYEVDFYQSMRPEYGLSRLGLLPRNSMYEMVIRYLVPLLQQVCITVLLEIIQSH